MSFNKPKNPLLDEGAAGMEDFHVARLEHRMRGDPGFPSRCGCQFTMSGPGRGRLISRCSFHEKNIEKADEIPGPTKE